MGHYSPPAGTTISRGGATSCIRRGGGSTRKLRLPPHGDEPVGVDMNDAPWNPTQIIRNRIPPIRISPLRIVPIMPQIHPVCVLPRPLSSIRPSRILARSFWPMIQAGMPSPSPTAANRVSPSAPQQQKQGTSTNTKMTLIRPSVITVPPRCGCRSPYSLRRRFFFFFFFRRDGRSSSSYSSSSPISSPQYLQRIELALIRSPQWGHDTLSSSGSSSSRVRPDFD